MLLHPLEIRVGVHKRAVRQCENPVFNVMVRVDDGEHEIMKINGQCATGNIDEIELHNLRVRRLASHHPRPVASFAVVN